jgi:hypothetical protein
MKSTFIGMVAMTALLVSTAHAQSVTFSDSDVREAINTIAFIQKHLHFRYLRPDSSVVTNIDADAPGISAQIHDHLLPCVQSISHSYQNERTYPQGTSQIGTKIMFDLAKCQQQHFTGEYSNYRVLVIMHHG